MDSVGKEKTKIEQAQRAMRKKEQDEGREWVRRYFTASMDPDPALEALAANVGLSENGDEDKTGGLWRFDSAKAEKVKGEVLSEEEQQKLAAELLGQ